MKKILSLRNTALAGVLAALLALWAGTRTWITVDVAATSVQVPQIVVDGASAAASVTALSVAVMAGALALLIAQRAARYVIGAITLLAGVAVALAGATVLADPQAAAADEVAKATGLAQSAGEYAVTGWPVVVIVAGALVALQSVAVLSLAHTWKKKASAKYERPAAAAKAAPKDASARNIASWEQLSAGEDPTEKQ